MNTAPRIDSRTQLFARVLGPYLVIAAVVMLARADRIPALLEEFGDSSALPWVCGAFVLLIGLTTVALHQRWRGAAAIAITVLGWLAVAEGVVLLAVPDAYTAFGRSMAEQPLWWQLVMVVVGVLGLCLTFVGWVPAGGRRPIAGAAPWDLPSPGVSPAG